MFTFEDIFGSDFVIITPTVIQSLSCTSDDFVFVCNRDNLITFRVAIRALILISGISGFLKISTIKPIISMAWVNLFAFWLLWPFDYCDDFFWNEMAFLLNMSITKNIGWKMYKYIGLATHTILMFVKGAKLCSSPTLAELAPAQVLGTKLFPIMFPDTCRCFPVLFCTSFDLPFILPNRSTNNSYLSVHLTLNNFCI